MAQVFISHAHGDEELVGKITTLLRKGLKLHEPDDVFVSSQGGRGVAPAANIRGEILKQLSSTPSLVVVVTPRSAASPWVWLEAGNRLGCADKSNPVFVVPSQRYLPLVQPVGDLRCVRLDHEDDLHELVKVVGENVGRPAQPALDYSADLRGLAEYTQSAYSLSGERNARVVAWLRSHAATLLVAAAVVLGVGVYGAWRVADLKKQLSDAATQADRAVADLKEQLSEAATQAIEAVNEEVSRTAGSYLVLNGKVVSKGGPVFRARVIASFQSNADFDCKEPDCTSDHTDAAGEFLLNLTKISAKKEDQIVLSVFSDGFQPYFKRVKVDVGVIDVKATQAILTLEPKR
jgi:hypothetical protein